jgi:glycerophosphoryl diester phosphodiesterase
MTARRPLVIGHRGASGIGPSTRYDRCYPVPTFAEILDLRA